VGHTHEDIDGKFGVLWKKLRKRFIDTPQAYAAAARSALQHPTEQPSVHDIFVVPNYDSFFRPFIDPHFGRFSKDIQDTEWTQHGYMFEKGMYN